MTGIKEVSLSFNDSNQEWTISNISNNEISIIANQKILFTSGDGKEYTVIVPEVNDHFATDSENYLFLINPFNLTITDLAENETTSPHLVTQMYVRINNRLIQNDAPPKIIIQPSA
jgi:hypothetical protein